MADTNPLVTLIVAPQGRSRESHEPLPCVDSLTEAGSSLRLTLLIRQLSHREMS